MAGISCRALSAVAACLVNRVALFADQLAAYLLQLALTHNAHGLDLFTAAYVSGYIRAVPTFTSATPTVRQQPLPR